jgi:hypothetical protein
MLKGYRGIIVAFAVGLTLVGAAPRDIGKAQTGQTATEQGAADQLNRIATALEKPEASEPPDAGCQPGQDNRKSNLCAQWKAADSAREAADWAKWQMWVSAFGLLGLVMSLHYTRKAVLAAEDATKDAEAALEVAERNAKAAQEQVTVSQDTAHRQLRAYLGFASVDTEQDEDLSPEGRARFLLKNFGQSPAIDVELRRTSRYLTGPLGADALDVEPEPVELVGKIQPGQFIPLSLWMEELSDTWSDLGNGYRVIWKIQADYTTVFGDKDNAEMVLVIERERVDGKVRATLLARHHRTGGDR